MLTSMLTSKTTPITLTLERFPGGEMLTSDFSYFSKFANNNNNSVYKNMLIKIKSTFLNSNLIIYLFVFYFI